jgi:hypothetical protein
MGCTGTVGPEPGRPGATDSTVEIYERATRLFPAAHFFKPLDQDPDAPPFKLAPLLLQEVNSSGPQDTPTDCFGSRAATDGLAPAPSPPKVYFDSDTVPVQGKPHLRFSYVWFYPSETPPGNRQPVQGVRLTLGAAGQPVIWEVLADASDKELIFVSQKLEAAAAARFGKPLPGRRYSVERGTNQTPHVVVARVIDDGPVPMGPIVYLRSPDRSVGTLLCRCMPAQAKKLTGTTPYLLEPWPTTVLAAGRWNAQVLPGKRAAFWPGRTESPPRLDQCLRLPDEF